MVFISKFDLEMMNIFMYILECMLPHHENQAQPNPLGNFHRQALFQVGGIP